MYVHDFFPGMTYYGFPEMVVIDRTCMFHFYLLPA